MAKEEPIRRGRVVSDVRRLADGSHIILEVRDPLEVLAEIEMKKKRDAKAPQLPAHLRRRWAKTTSAQSLW